MNRLSDAIREGSQMRAASESGWTDLGPDGKIRTCALVAACEAAGIFMMENGCLVMGPMGTPGNYEDEDQRVGGKPTLSAQIPKEWMVIVDALEYPPCCCSHEGGKATVIMIIWHLHDVHRWKREEVADWIELLEAKILSRIKQNEAAAAAAPSPAGQAEMQKV